MRKSELVAEFRLHGGRTVLYDVYFTSPLKVTKPFPVEGASGGLLVTVMDVSPGLMDGDKYELEWHVGEGCSAAVTTQSYAKVHPCPQSGVSQTTRITVGEGASLVYAPQPMMLYADASFIGSMEADLAPGASLLFIDTLCAGRVHYSADGKCAGEAFQYRLYENELAVAVQGKIAVVNRVRYAPGEQALRAVGVFEQYTHAGTLYGFGPFVSRSAAEALLNQAERNRNIRCGVSLLARGGLTAAVLGSSAWEVHETLMAMGRTFAAFALEHAPRGSVPFAWPDW